MEANFTKDDLILKSNAERYSILQAIIRFRKRIGDETIISIGDGPSHYRKVFKNYIGFDIDKNNKNTDFIADTYNIPIKSRSVGAILNIQVMEHLKHPKNCLKESQRILKKGGKMLITVPQITGLHDEPNDYFRYTPYSLKFMLEEAGFTIISIKPRGGYFWVLSNMFKKMRLYTPIILRPVIIPIFSFLLPLLLFYMDNLDREKKITLGYEIFAVKK